MELTTAFRRQSTACAEMGSPMYAALLARAADDIDAGGPVRDVLAGHEDDPGPSALALRLMGSVHRLVLERRAGELAAYYPSVGGSWEPDGGWAAFRSLLLEQPGTVAEWLDRPPQTNEVGRATALYGGLLQLSGGPAGDLPVRLFEMGSSAGLNLRADRFAYVDATGTTFGDPASPVRLEPAWRGRPLVAAEPVLVERRGCDVHPVDPATTEGRTLLTAYVWPDQRDRLERLRGALQIAGAVPAEVRRESAAAFVGSLDLVPGTVTVLWHSVMWQYLADDEQRAVTHLVEELGAAAGTRSPFVHLSAEPARRAPGAPHEFLVRMRVWPTGESRLLGHTGGHGVPTVWE
jgi:hypothetical protein